MKKTEKQKNIAISTYHEYILEAISSLKIGLIVLKESNLFDDDDDDNYRLFSNPYCRYAFLMIANSIEAAANALLLSLNLDKKYYEDLEKLNTLLKFRIFCNFNGKKIDQGNVKYSNIKEIIDCRNEFVHPKPQIVNYKINTKRSIIEYSIKHTKKRNYPYYFSEIKPKHSLIALEDTLKFLSWVCFDICKMKIKEGSTKLGINLYMGNADIHIIEDFFNIKFDKRTFGLEK